MIRYNIASDNTVRPEGELDKAVFDEDFADKTLNGVIMKQENFIKWCQMIYTEDLAKRTENRLFNGSFGTWLVHKIGQKGVQISVILAKEFEGEYSTKKMKAMKGFIALADFLKLDWLNVERQFIEDRFIAHCIDDKKKKVRKIVNKARRMKNKALATKNINKEK